MYRRSSHEPRYKHSTRVRHAESNESSEESSSSEEDEESTDVSTGESLFTVGSQESRSFQDSEGRPTRKKSRTKFDNSDKFHINSYFGVSKKIKKDQFTQKNLLSPFPSYSIPPIHREVSKAPYYRVSNAMPLSEDRHHFQNEEKSSAQFTKKRESHGGEEAKLTKKNQEKTERKFCEKHKPIKDGRTLKTAQPEVIKCNRHGHKMESSIKSLKPTVEAENLPKNSTKAPAAGAAAATTTRRSKNSSRGMECAHQTTKNCPACALGLENQSKLKRKPGVDAGSFEKDPKPRDVIIEKDSGDSKTMKNRGKEIKEKLMYVVEEEGKSATKIETDLFSVNEILAIKKDLIELSEFAKKLKKLKEKKKDSESEKSKGNFCQCQVPEGLLSDVNKRIEALEARQAELERRSQGNSNKEDLEYESKKTACPVTPSTSPPKTPIVAKSSAITTVQSMPKTELLVTRAAGFPHNSDIVSELMDIKIQLEKLEKKRMLKNDSKEKETNIPNTKEHAIAVFSSKTYILTNENFDKTKNGNAKSKIELTKENVANWLKNVSLERTDNELSMLLSADRAKREESILEKKKRIAEIKCKMCTGISKQENYENQEPQKKEVPEHLGRGSDLNFAYLFDNQPSEAFKLCKKRKNTFMTPSGRFFTVLSKSSQDVTRRFSQTDPSGHMWPSSKVTGRRSSSGSIPSTIFIKQQLKKFKSKWNKRRNRENINIIRKKSIQELSESSVTSKTERSSRKNIFDKDKKSRERKNEYMKRLETQFIALAKNLGKVDPSNSSYSYSELLASVNLESDQMTFDAHNSQEIFNRNDLFMYAAATKENEAASIETCKPEPKKCKKAKKRKKKKKSKSDGSEISKIRACEKKFKKEEKEEIKRLKKALKKQKRKCRRQYQKHHPSCCRKKCHQCISKTPLTSQHKFVSDRTECTSSQATRETFDCKGPPPEPPCSSRSPDLPIIREKCHKTCRRSSLIKESIDISTLRKILKNLKHCYPKLSSMKFCTYNDDCIFKRPKRSCFKMIKPDPFGRYCFCENYRNPCKSRSNHTDNCKCVRLFLAQTEPKFSNFEPFQMFPDESQTNVTTSTRTEISSDSFKSDFVVPSVKPQIYYVGSVSEEHGDHHRNHRKHRSRKKKCVCEKCGNVHEIHVYEPKAERQAQYEGDCKSRDCESKGFSSRKGDIFPLFSLFSHFCRSRKSEGGTLRRYWSKVKGPSKSRDRTVYGPPCNCKEKFVKVETRLKEVENEQDKARQRHKYEEEKVEKKEKNEKKEKKKKKRERKHKKKPHRSRSRRKKESNKKKKEEAAAYYYTINTPSTVQSILNSSTEPKKSTETTRSSLRFLCKNKKISEGLTSLHSFWKNLRDRKIKNRVEKMVSKIKGKSAFESNDLIDDPSRSSQIPRGKQVLELNEEPTSFLKRKQKRKKKEKSSSKMKSKREKHK